MISALQWVRKGAAKEHPEKFKLNEEEMDEFQKIASERLIDAKMDLKAAREAAMDVDMDGSSDEEDDANMEEDKAAETGAAASQGDDDLAEYNLDTYDEEIAADQEQGKAGMFAGRKDIAYYKDEKDDPYVTLKDKELEEEEEKDELRIMPTDNLLLAAKTEDDVSQLEVHVYEKEEENLYTHHDIILPSFPLCIEWIDFHTGDKAGAEGAGNYVAIGTFEPDIEIWNLDVVDTMIPQTILGHTNKEKKRSKKVNDKYHVDAVMDLAWNKQHRNFLLSSSADKTVKLWDLSNSTCVQSYNHHQDKVQSVSWNPAEATVFLTGAYDRTICVLDARSPEATARWTVGSDVESLAWDVHNPTHFYVATEDGMVQYFDVRAVNNGVGAKSLFTLQAHDGAVSALDINPVLPGCIATGSTDKQVKIWNTANNKPSMVTSKNFELGHIFSARFCPDSPYDLALAGSAGQVHVWDISKNPGVRQAYGQ
ncbi:WD40-repeat-containing domain protein [Syncephalastrum racemosum]|uniref:WD40-repeat-containing domain protein n=1 Tax=Syncephalastrum racemosum TaxID=13706 RepID=A0A1X2HI87_SYNRA|nr:WD40-repeat-containing domain protein [Syncephalastrum racemosum]